MASRREGQRHAKPHGDTPLLLGILDAISQGYSHREATDELFESDGINVDWLQARKRLWAELGALNDVQAFRSAVERGLIRVEVRRR